MWTTPPHKMYLHDVHEVIPIHIILDKEKVFRWYVYLWSLVIFAGVLQMEVKGDEFTFNHRRKWARWRDVGAVLDRNCSRIVHQMSSDMMVVMHMILVKGLSINQEQMHNVCIRHCTACWWLPHVYLFYLLLLSDAGAVILLILLYSSTQSWSSLLFQERVFFRQL